MACVLLADDWRLLRHAFHTLMELHEDTAVVGEASSGQEAVELVQCMKPDVVVIDLAMPVLSGDKAVE